MNEQTMITQMIERLETSLCGLEHHEKLEAVGLDIDNVIDEAVKKALQTMSFEQLLDMFTDLP